MASSVLVELSLSSFTCQLKEHLPKQVTNGSVRPNANETPNYFRPSIAHWHAGFWGDWLPVPPRQTLTVAWGEIGGPRFPQGRGMDKWRENDKGRAARMEMRQGVGWRKAREAFLLKETMCSHGGEISARVASGPRGRNCCRGNREWVN